MKEDGHFLTIGAKDDPVVRERRRVTQANRVVNKAETPRGKPLGVYR